MSTSQQTLSVPANARVVRDDNANSSVRTALSGGTTPVRFYIIQVDNTNNPNQDVYLKMYDFDAPVVGSTNVQFQIFAPAGKVVTWMVQNSGTYVEFSLGFSTACVTTPGTGGTTSPPATVSWAMLASW